MKIILSISTLFLFVVNHTCAQGVVLWDEAVNGPLSNASSAATALASLQVGTNTIVGELEIVPNGGIWTVYEDFFVLDLPVNLMVDKVYLQIDKPDVQTWIGNSSFSSQLGFSPSSPPGELLSHWGINGLSTGSYGMYLANHDAQVFTSVAN